MTARIIQSRRLPSGNPAAGGYPAEVAVVLTALSAVLALVADLWQGAEHLLLAPAGAAGVAVTMLAGAALVGALAAILAKSARLGRVSAAIPLIGRAAALGDQTWSNAWLRLRDPDAAGRPRPRAPSAALAAATS